MHINEEKIEKLRKLRRDLDRRKNEEKRKKERKRVLKKALRMCNRWRANLLKFLEARRLKQTKKVDKSNWVTLRLIKMLMKGNYGCK